MFEKVMVCLDGSELAEAILPYIMQESNCYGSIVLLRVLATPEVTLPLGIPGVPGVAVHTDSMLEHFRRDAEEAPAYMEKIADSLRETGLKAASVILEGMPGEAILEYAGDNDVTLIALATHGHGGLAKAILGSTAAYILKHSPVPVLTITPRKA